LLEIFKVDEPDRVWVADITYVWTLQGWMYLAVIIDLFSRRVVGWSMAEHMRVDLVLTALSASLGKRVPADAGWCFTLTGARNARPVPTVPPSMPLASRAA